MALDRREVVHFTHQLFQLWGGHHDNHWAENCSTHDGPTTRVGSQSLAITTSSHSRENEKCMFSEHNSCPKVSPLDYF